ncbi:MAG: proton extrusion protein PcxA, partial [Cyanobacteria bacterium CAN_BIN43]|nr:proton extrusion protein PcxA [Cyanobacteria bacterium CAN_BIN43]
MRNSFWGSVQSYFSNANQWLLKTPGRSLDEAYEAALKIREIENANFGGNRISVDYGDYGLSAQNYFQGELKKYLDIIKIRLAEFKLSSSVVRLSNQKITEIEVDENSNNLSNINIIDQPALILKKLKFIDETLDSYQNRESSKQSIVILPDNQTRLAPSTGRLKGIADDFERTAPESKSMSGKSGILPRSILNTVDRIKQELNPDSEEEMVRDFRRSKVRTFTAVRFILILIIVPLLVQQMSKNFVIGPIVDQYRIGNEKVDIFINSELEEEALNELQKFEQRLRFEILIGRSEPKSDAEIAEQVKEKAAEIGEEFQQVSSDAVKNIFADLSALIAFTLVIMTSKREIEVVKSFIDQLVYGLSDSAKAFFIILLTDMFVGFHSPHGWEVVLEGASKHFGLPADRNFIFLFIATFPVILDTMFKYWIFRYLNRASPSS